MKKLFFALLFASGLLVANAQTTPPPPANPPAKPHKPRLEAPARAKKQTDRMAVKLGLSEEQKTKVYSINLKKNMQLDSAFALKKDDKDPAFGQFRKKTNKERATEIKALLTLEQVQKWEQLKKELKAKKAQHKQGPKGPAPKPDAKPEDRDMKPQPKPEGQGTAAVSDQEDEILMELLED